MARKRKRDYRQAGFSWLHHHGHGLPGLSTKLTCPVCLRVTECIVKGGTQEKLYLRGAKQSQEDSMLSDALVEEGPFSSLDVNYVALVTRNFSCSRCASVFIKIYHYQLAEKDEKENDEDTEDEEVEVARVDLHHFEELTTSVVIRDKTKAPDYFYVSDGKYAEQKDLGISVSDAEFLSGDVCESLPVEARQFWVLFPKRFNEVLIETKSCIAQGNSILATAGARCLIELLCQMTGENTVKGTSKKNFDRFFGLNKLGVLNDKRKNILNATYQAGNRAVHDGSGMEINIIIKSVNEIEKTARDVWQLFAEGDIEKEILEGVPERIKWDAVKPTDAERNISIIGSGDNVVPIKSAPK